MNMLNAFYAAIALIPDKQANFQEAKCFLPSLATNLLNIKIRSRYFSLLIRNVLPYRAVAISLL